MATQLALPINSKDCQEGLAEGEKLKDRAKAVRWLRDNPELTEEETQINGDQN